MAIKVTKAEYHYAVVNDQSGVAAGLFKLFKQNDVNLLAFHAFPAGNNLSQIDFFPKNPKRFGAILAESGVKLTGPNYAFLLQGVDSLGAITEHHELLAKAEINVRASSGVVDGEGHFGYIIWVKPEDYDKAAEILGV